MAVPKRRTSRSKRNMRRANHDKVTAPQLVPCSNCGEPTVSHRACPSCGHESDIFGRGGGEQLATDLTVAFLGPIPLYQPIRTGGDSGIPIVIGEPDAPASKALMAVAERVAQQISIASFARRAIPLTPTT